MLGRSLAVVLAATALATEGCGPGVPSHERSGRVGVEVVGPATPVVGADYAPGDIPTHLPPACLPPPQPEGVQEVSRVTTRLRVAVAPEMEAAREKVR